MGLLVSNRGAPRAMIRSLAASPRARHPKRMKPVVLLAVAVLVLAGCESIPERSAAAAGATRSLIVGLARHEWDLFGGQQIHDHGAVETISPVGAWEDEDPQSARVQRYWAAVGKPEWDGKHCEEPWSAAFVSWVMRTAGVPANEFLPAIAHWMYLQGIVRRTGELGRSFAAWPLRGYAPKPGDLVCATRGGTTIPVSDTLPPPALLERAKLHCNIVVDVTDRHVLAIGGNVRNSVSQVFLPLDATGRLVSSKEHPWFVVVENRLPR